MIKVFLEGVDGSRSARSYKTIEKARIFAHGAVGASPEIGSRYAISGDGVCKVTVQGATLAELFPATVAPAPRAQRHMSYEQWQGDFQADDNDANADELADRMVGDMIVPHDPNRPSRHFRCTCSDPQLIHVGCDCAESRGDAPAEICPF